MHILKNVVDKDDKTHEQLHKKMERPHGFYLSMIENAGGVFKKYDKGIYKNI